MIYIAEPYLYEANALYVFEGNELLVKATQDIAGGQEITLRYLGNHYDYDFQRDI